MEACYSKRALIRDPNVPVGQPARIHIDCECGRTVYQPETGPSAVWCPCGLVYDACGWITYRPTQVVNVNG
jgi:hypothetical protein